LKIAGSCLTDGGILWRRIIRYGKQKNSLNPSKIFKTKNNYRYSR
jgi:hypothetical protein